MRALALLPLTIALTTGCGADDATLGPAASPAAPEATTASEMPDVETGMVKGMCANGPGAEGADSHFTGRFEVKDGMVSGREAWVLFANPKWQARGGKDCRLIWDVKGKVVEPRNCSGCDLGIEFHAVPRLDSNCPEELVQGRELPTGQRVGGEGVAFDQVYSIQRMANGKARVYFGKSGKLLGEGYHVGDSVSWLSAHSCKWF